MDQTLYESLIKEKEYLEEQERKLKNELRNVPEGTLRVMMSKGKYPQYYLISPNAEDNTKRGIYLTKEKRGLAKEIAQKEYNEKLLSEIQRRLVNLRRFLSNSGIPLESYYDTLPLARRMLVKPIIQPEEEFVERWKNAMKTGGNSYPITSSIYTEKGEHVRSKSEKIFADMLEKRGIPYVYEPILIINKNTILYPDFAILNLRTRKTLYHEHFGMMDDSDYAKKAISKIDTYQKNGFWFGENLLFTFESKENPADSRSFQEMILRYCI